MDPQNLEVLRGEAELSRGVEEGWIRLPRAWQPIGLGPRMVSELATSEVLADGRADRL
jgi:hypothetical protein